MESNLLIILNYDNVSNTFKIVSNPFVLRFKTAQMINITYEWLDYQFTDSLAPHNVMAVSMDRISKIQKV